MKTRIFLTLIFSFLLISYPAFAVSPQWVSGVVMGFNVQTGLEPGVEFSSPNKDYVFRICLPTQPGYDPSYYFFELLKQANIERRVIEVAYIERLGLDPETGRNKLCVAHIKY